MTVRPVLLALLALGAVACQTAETPPATDSAIASVTGADSAAAPLTTPAITPDAAPGTLGPDGWGPLRIGMTRDEVVAAAGPDANPELVGGPEPEQCDEFRPARAPEGMLVMVQQGRLTRITLMRDSPVRTDRGLAVGDSAAAVRAAYGAELTASPHKYVDAPAEYLTVWTSAPPADDARGIRYVVGADGRVTHVHAGDGSIEYVEGCL